MGFYPNADLDPLLMATAVIGQRIEQLEKECKSESDKLKIVANFERIAHFTEISAHVSNAIEQNLLFCELFFLCKIMNGVCAAENAVDGISPLAGLEARILLMPVNSLDKYSLTKEMVRTIIDKSIFGMRTAFAVERQRNSKDAIEEWGNHYKFVHRFSAKVISHPVQEWFQLAGKEFIN